MTLELLIKMTLQDVYSNEETDISLREMMQLISQGDDAADAGGPQKKR